MNHTTRVWAQPRVHLLAVSVACMMAVFGLADAASPAGGKDAKAGFVSDGSLLFMVFANCVEGQDQEFNAWYDRHMKAIVKLPGFVRAQRFLMQPRAGRPDPAYKYVVVYEMRGDPSALMAEIGQGVKEGKVEAPDSRLVLKTDGMVYKPITAAY